MQPRPSPTKSRSRFGNSLTARVAAATPLKGGPTVVSKRGPQDLRASLRSGARGPGGLAEVEFGLDHMVERRARGRQHHFDHQFAAAGVLLAHDPFDLALRGDADLFQEFSQGHVEFIFVHQQPPARSQGYVLDLGPCPRRRGPDRIQRRCREFLLEAIYSVASWIGTGLLEPKLDERLHGPLRPLDRPLRSTRDLSTRVRHRPLRLSLYLLYGGAHDVFTKKGSP